MDYNNNSQWQQQLCCFRDLSWNCASGRPLFYNYLVPYVCSSIRLVASGLLISMLLRERSGIRRVHRLVWPGARFLPGPCIRGRNADRRPWSERDMDGIALRGPIGNRRRPAGPRSPRNYQRRAVVVNAYMGRRRLRLSFSVFSRRRPTAPPLRVVRPPLCHSGCSAHRAACRVGTRFRRCYLAACCSASASTSDATKPSGFGEEQLNHLHLYWWTGTWCQLQHCCSSSKTGFFFLFYSPPCCKRAVHKHGASQQVADLLRQLYLVSDRRTAVLCPSHVILSGCIRFFSMPLLE